MANLTKDQRLIRDNPDATPEQLLEMGLSQKGYADLKAKQAENTKQEEVKVVQKVQPVVTQNTARAMPRTTPPKVSATAGMAWLVNKKNGKRLYMAEAQVLRQIKKYPAEYEIVYK